MIISDRRESPTSFVVGIPTSVCPRTPCRERDELSLCLLKLTEIRLKGFKSLYTYVIETLFKNSYFFKNTSLQV